MIINKNISKMIKGIAALFVLLNHIRCWIGELFQIGTTAGEFMGRLSDIGMFCFLFMSGYGLYSSFQKSGIQHFWEKKIAKIYVPMIMANLVGIVTYYLFQGVILERQEFFWIFLGRLDSSNGIMWYIHYLFVWYLFFWLSVKLIENKRIFVVSWIVITCIMAFITPGGYGLANEYFLAFPCGVLMALCSKRRWPREDWLIIIGLILIPLATLLFRDKPHTIGGREINFWLYCLLINMVLFTATLGIICLLIRLRSQKAKNLLIKLGEYSLGIYLLQEPVIHWGGLRFVNQTGTAAVAVILGVVIILILIQLYRRTIGKLMLIG